MFYPNYINKHKFLRVNYYLLQVHFVTLLLVSMVIIYNNNNSP